MKKKFLGLVFSVVTAGCLLGGCGEQKENVQQNAPVQTQDVQPTETEVETPTEAPTEAPAETSAVGDGPAEGSANLLCAKGVFAPGTDEETSGYSIGVVGDYYAYFKAAADHAGVEGVGFEGTTENEFYAWFKEFDKQIGNKTFMPEDEKAALISGEWTPEMHNEQVANYCWSDYILFENWAETGEYKYGEQYIYNDYAGAFGHMVKPIIDGETEEYDKEELLKVFELAYEDYSSKFSEADMKLWLNNSGYNEWFFAKPWPMESYEEMFDFIKSDAFPDYDTWKASK